MTDTGEDTEHLLGQGMEDADAGTAEPVLEPVAKDGRCRLDTLPSSVADVIRDINRQLNFPKQDHRLLMVYGGEGIGKTFALGRLAGCLDHLPSVKGRRRVVMRMRASMAAAGSDIIRACGEINELKGESLPVILCGGEIDQAVMMSGECPRATFIVEERDKYVSQLCELDDGTIDLFTPVPMSSSATWGELMSEAHRMSVRTARGIGVTPMTGKAVDAFMDRLLSMIYPSRRSRPDDDEQMDLTFGYVSDRIAFAYARSIEPPYDGRRILIEDARLLADGAFNDRPPDVDDMPTACNVIRSSPRTAEVGARQSERRRQGRIMGYKDPLGLPDRLRRDVIGQDGAVDALSSSILLDAAHMKRPDRPVGSFLFVGPSGVGKTQLAKSLAAELLDGPMNFIRIDCSELAERHTESRLFGAPPGYIGFESGGELTGSVREHPQSVILMDEAEKANPHVWDVFLQVFDAARLTDGSGVVTDFSHCIVILTSNLGSDSPNSAGFGAGTDDAHAYDDAVRNYFRPEFINRLDGVCMFNRLDMESYKRIIDMKIRDAERRMRKNYSCDVSIRLDDATVSWLLRSADSDDHGARGLDDAIGGSILLPIAKGILAKDIDIAGAGVINVTTDESGPRITMKAGTTNG